MVSYHCQLHSITSTSLRELSRLAAIVGMSNRGLSGHYLRREELPTVGGTIP